MVGWNSPGATPNRRYISSDQRTALVRQSMSQLPTPAIGFLRPSRADESGHLVAAVREGLRESGYPTDKAVIESRWGDGHEERLPKLAVELVGLQVAAIVAGSLPSARAAKAATASIPIIFVTGADPQTEGLVSSISRPGGKHDRRELL